MFKGIYTALATPMTKDGAVNYPALSRLIEAQLSAGVDGVVLLGTTAEAATLNAPEKEELLHFCTQKIRGKAKIIIGTGTNNTVSTVENTRRAAAFKPDGVLVVTPYYNKPNPAGLVAHYQAVAQVGLPIVMYHIPGRTGLKVPAGVLGQLLAQVPQIVGIKESDYDIAHVTETAVTYSNHLSYLCGNDDLFPEFLALHASGIISAAANVLAPAFVRIYRAFEQGHPHQAFEIFAALYPLIKACYLETNPTCIKYMLAQLGFGTETARLPLGKILDENKQKINRLLAAADKSFFIR